MIITINTKEDSREDIRKAIDFLQKFIQEQGSSEMQLPQQGLFDLFAYSSGQQTSVPSSQEPKSETRHAPSSQEEDEEKKYPFEDLEAY